MMKTFTLHIQSATQYTPIKHVNSFVGADPSGSFGILAGHARMMTSLSYGLARYEVEDGNRFYLAFPGGILYFLDNHLYISSRRFLCDNDYERISSGLMQQLLAEEESLREIKSSLSQLEQEMFRRLWQMKRTGNRL